MKPAARPRLRTSTLAILTALAVGAIAGASQAATFTVTTSDDGADVSVGDGVCDGSADASVDCTLRAAIQEANATAAADTIILPARPDPYVLTLLGSGPAAGDLDVAGDLTISGAGPHQTWIVGLFEQPFAGRVIAVAAGATATLRGLTISGGETCGAGGGIQNAGDLTIHSSIVRNNLAEMGGGVSNTGTLTVIDSTVTGNRSVVVGLDPTGSCVGSGVTGGGGLMSTAGSVGIVNSTVSRNAAPSRGGGLLNEVGSTASLLHVTISGNGAAGAVDSRGAATVQNSIIAGGAQPACNVVAATTLASAGGNVISDTSCAPYLTHPTDQHGVSPRLEPLTVDSGTEVHPLAADSPAVDAAVGCPPPERDQRRVSRPQGPACDAGAFERIVGGGSAPVPAPSVLEEATDPPPKSVCTITGTPGPDILIGTRKRDIICGLGGNDRLVGKSGADTLIGGRGRDLLLGGRGKDSLWGGRGNDRLVGARGPDRILGGRGRDLLIGGRGRDTLRGGRGRDRAVWTRGQDRIFGMEPWPVRLLPELERLRRNLAGSPG